MQKTCVVHVVAPDGAAHSKHFAVHPFKPFNVPGKADNYAAEQRGNGNKVVVTFGAQERRV